MLDRRGFVVGTGAVATAIAAKAYAAPQDVDLGDTPLTVGPYLPVDPRQVLKVKVVKDGSEQEVYYASLKESEVRDTLGIQKALITIQMADQSGKLHYLGNGASAQKGYYEVTIDYGRFRDENIISGGKFLGRGRVGVGLRLKAKLNVRKSNLNIGSLLPISTNIAENRMGGSIESTVIGINNPRVSDLIQLPTTISQDTIQKAIESMGAIKVLVDAPDTKTNPHLLAVGLAGSETDRLKVANSIP